MEHVTMKKETFVTIVVYSTVEREGGEWRRGSSGSRSTCFDGKTRQINTLLNYINNINTNLQFTVEIESNNEINFLDVTKYTKYKVQRKTTTTDMVIHANSFHSVSQKMVQ